MDIADSAATPAEAPELVDRSSISVLGIRRRYWELTHGWAVSTNAPEAPDIDAPGRVA